MSLLEERPVVAVRRPPGLDALLRRLHFHAGVFVAPFLFVAAFTELLYAFAPQLDGLVYHHELHVAVHGDPRPVAAQVEAAVAGSGVVCSRTGQRPAGGAACPGTARSGCGWRWACSSWPRPG